MDSEYKQRISLYLDKETVEKMDEAIKKYDYRSRNDFVSSAVDNLVADRLLLGENDTVISEKLSRAIAQMSEAQTLQIAKYVSLRCGDGTHHADVLRNIGFHSEQSLKKCEKKQSEMSAGQEVKSGWMIYLNAETHSHFNFCAVKRQKGFYGKKLIMNYWEKA